MLMAYAWLKRLAATAFVNLCLVGGAIATDWPRTFTNADGSQTVIADMPTRILSTSVTVTGTLLAIDAPVVASATAANGRYFAQWSEVAQERGVKKLWPAGSVDLELAYVLAPDLIVIASGGADSALAQRAELQQIAPTIVVDYGGQTWQSLAKLLGEASGLEQQTAQHLAAFDAYVAQSKAQIQPPSGLANIISYNGPGAPNPVATADGVHGQLLKALGFELEAPSPEWQAGTTATNDFVRSQYEHLTLLKAPTTFLLGVGEERAQAFLRDPMLVNLPAVKNRQVFGLGENSFRVDYFSARQIVDNIVRRFGSAATAVSL
ncbi:MAG: Fe2+-enterobactin ABC transporter substrate-binding protein [Gammaproteobacteria bacterium]|nr:Fe2+-enterobactin ABC transporter substrate-binding protein [Gammaproteobacteria bacterium]